MLGFLFKKKGTADKKSRSGSYWIYVGEFTLVFLGILIALQVENWNQERQERKLEQVLLAEMLSNLKADLDDIDYNTRMQQGFLNSSRVVLEFLQSDLPWHDSLGFHFTHLLGGSVFDNNNSAYESLKSIGIDLIRNDTLRQQISMLYEASYAKVETTQDMLFGYGFNQLYSSLRDNIRTLIPGEMAIPVDLTQLRKNNGFLEDLHMTIRMYNLSKYTFMSARKEAEKLIEAIEEELSHKI
jgi:hypothetical protein